MLVKDATQTGPAAEIKIVPSWAWVLAGIAFVGSQVAFHIVLAHQPDAPPIWAPPLLGLLVGLLLGCFVLFIGYINRDAKRRGMSPVLWTIVAILIPNAMGILLYFVLRQPLRSPCPQCGNAVQPRFNLCPPFGHRLRPSLPPCQHLVGVNAVFCPYCGTSLRNQAA